MPVTRLSTSTSLLNKKYQTISAANYVQSNILIVAGGGGGGGTTCCGVYSGGGGAGGLYLISPLIKIGSYAVVVGSGGAGKTVTGHGDGTAGSNSSINFIRISWNTWTRKFWRNKCNRWKIRWWWRRRSWCSRRKWWSNNKWVRRYWRNWNSIFRIFSNNIYWCFWILCRRWRWRRIWNWFYWFWWRSWWCRRRRSWSRI